MKDKGFTPLILIFSLAIIGVIAVFVFPKISSISKQTPISTQTSNDEKEVLTTNRLYTNSEKNFSFEYPKEIEEYTYSNGVIAFFKQEDIQNCKKFQETQNSGLQDACYKAVFNLSGFEVLSQNDYQKKVSSQASEDVYIPKTVVDSQNRTWKTFQMLGESFNFDAYTTNNGKYIGIHFQSLTDKREFFNQTLSTIKILE